MEAGAHFKWLADQRLSEAATEKTAELYRRWVGQARAELERTEEAIRKFAPRSKCTDALAQRLIRFHGIEVRSNVRMASELLDVRRFFKASQ